MGKENNRQLMVKEQYLILQVENTVMLFLQIP